MAQNITKTSFFVAGGLKFNGKLYNDLEYLMANVANPIIILVIYPVTRFYLCLPLNYGYKVISRSLH